MKINRDETAGLRCFLVTSKYTEYQVQIGSQHACNCQDYGRNRGKPAFIHILWTLLFICGIQEDSEMLQQVSLTVEEVRQIASNTPNIIPESFKVMEATNNSTQRRKERTTNLLKNDSRNANPQIWYLERKEKKRGQTPRCRGCRDIQKDGELCLLVTGLYVPYEQNFVVETTFYFCPNTSCISRLQPWTNLKQPQVIHAKKSVLSNDISKLDLGQIRIVPSGP